MSLQVRGSGGTERIRKIADEKITRELRNIDGIASVEVSGGNVKAIEIIFDEEACREHAISPRTIRSLISLNNSLKQFLGLDRGLGKGAFVKRSTIFNRTLRK